MSSKVYCIAEFAPKVGCEDKLFKLLAGLEPLSLREDGCVKYRVTHQIINPNAPSNSKFSIMFNEEWASVEAFNDHCTKPYLIDFFKTYVENPETSLVDDCQVRLFSDELGV